MSSADTCAHTRGQRYVVPRVRDYGTIVAMTANLGLYGQYGSFLTGEPPPPTSTPENPCTARNGC